MNGHAEIIIVCGPTCSGKTEKALDLVPKVNGEIVSVDSLQIYREMDIGTAKPSKNILEKFPHHMVDVVNPDESFDAQQYADGAAEAIRLIVHRGKTPVLVGGAGLYFRALLEGFFEGPKADPILRQKWEAAALENGKGFVYGHLKKIDPKSAELIHPNNLRKVIRAIEIFEVTKTKFSSLKKNPKKKAYKFRELFFLNPPREKLFENIEMRTRRMFASGLVDETEHLLKKYSRESPPLNAIGYKQAADYLQGGLSEGKAIEQVIFKTRQYARRQLTWFRHQGVGGIFLHFPLTPIKH